MNVLDNKACLEHRNFIGITHKFYRNSFSFRGKNVGIEKKNSAFQKDPQETNNNSRYLPLILYLVVCTFNPMINLMKTMSNSLIFPQDKLKKIQFIFLLGEINYPHMLRPL
jgi:hypothetical protein